MTRVVVKTWLLTIVIIAFGAALGERTGTPSLWMLSPCGILLAADRAPADGDTLATASPRRSGPRVSVDREEHNFGKADVGVIGRHPFVFTNTGNEPLVLSKGRSTCGCCTCVCAVQLPQGAISPGRSAEVALEWKSKLYVGPFRQTATILTNDPDRREVTLRIIGRFAGPVGVVPSQLSFNSLRMGRAATGDVRLYNYLEEPLRIMGYQLSNPQSAKYFDVAWERLAAEQLRVEESAQAGYMVRITVKPGLPVGAFQQQIILTTNSKSVPTVQIPVLGSVVGEISIAGRGWNARTGVLTMGTVSSSRGAKWPLVVVVRGPHAKDVRLKSVQPVPEFLDVELGSARYISDKAISLTRLTIRIPPGTEPSTHRGAEQGQPARITLQTNLPHTPDVNIQVRFTIGE